MLVISIVVAINSEIAVIHKDVTLSIHQIELFVFKYAIVAGIQIEAEIRKIRQSIEMLYLEANNFDENSSGLDLNIMPYEKAKYPAAANSIDTVKIDCSPFCTPPHSVSRWSGKKYKQTA